MKVANSSKTQNQSIELWHRVLKNVYNIIYEYQNDCLTAALEYNKNYYDDRDIKPEESIFFKLTIMPFGQIASTPDLMN